MAGISPDDKAEIRRRSSIVEVVSERVVLKRAGKEHIGLCPFHNEKTPSFTVNEEKRIFKCFGCGENGDVFTFVQKTRNCGFVEAARHLADKYGVQLVETAEDREEYDRRTAVLMLYQQASQFYIRMLHDPEQGAVARAYLEKRGVPNEIVEQFKLGFAPTSWDSLLRYLTSSTKVAPATLEQAGLIRRRQDSAQHYDLFRNRLMIPIMDDQGRVIAFGGRTLGDDQVKYLNSPETPIYKKGDNLFALNLARESIKQKDSVIVVEGYFDAITPHQFGFTNAVATLGTALTEQQARSLVRYTESKRVYLAFDADAAGIKAVERGGETLNQIAEGIGIDLRVVKIPGGKDPDECLRSQEENGGPEAFRKALEKALPLIDNQLEAVLSTCNTSSHTGKIDAARKIVPILAQIKNAVARGEYIRQWSMRVGVREEELLSDVGQFRRDNHLTPRSQSMSSWQKNRTSEHRSAGGSSRLGDSGIIAAEQQLLALFLTSREDHERVAEVVDEDEFFTPAHQSILQAVLGVGSQFNTVEDLQYKLMDRLGSDNEATSALVEIVLKVDEVRKQNAPIDTLLVQSKGKLLKQTVERELLRLRALMNLNSTNSESDIDLRTLQGKIVQIKGLLESMVSATTLENLKEIKRKLQEIVRGAEVNPT